MSPHKKHLSRGIFLLVLIFGGALLAFSLFSGQSNSFPRIAAGIYQGEISGLGEAPSRRYSFYLERRSDSKVALVVVFIEGFQPQVVSLDKMDDLPQRAFQPLLIHHAGSIYSLTGRGKNNKLSGKLNAGTEEEGSWSLALVDRKSLDGSLPQATAFSSGLKRWLELKGTYQLLSLENEKLEEKIHSIRETTTSFQNIVDNSSLYGPRVEQLVATTEAKLNEESTEHDTILQELKNRVFNLEQLMRITKRGRTIELARRVTTRENKWYLVNWESGEDLSAMEESVAQQLNLDPRKVRHNIERANEYLRLRNEIAIEKKRVLELQNLSRQGSSEGQPKRKRSWWKRWNSMS